MTELEILNLAYDTAIIRWENANKHHEMNPTNKILEARERKYSEQVDWIRNRILELTNAE